MQPGDSAVSFPQDGKPDLIGTIGFNHSNLFSNMREACAVHEIILDCGGRPVDYRFIDVNPAFALMTGLTADQVLGRTVRQVSSTGESEWAERYGRIALGGGSERFEAWSSGLGRWLDVSAFAVGNLRFATIFTDITERKKTEAALRTDEARLRSLVRLLQHPVSDEQELLDVALQEAVSLTASPYGYIYSYDEDSRLFILNSWSGNVMADCGVIDKQTIYRLEDTGFWGDAVRLRRAIVDNDFISPSPTKKGFPDGHVSLSRFLSVPISLSGRIVGVVGIANKAEPYDDADAQQLVLLLTPVFFRIERSRVEGEKLQLVREVHHRVKNNLQMIISLMELQSTFSMARESLALMKAMQSRIYSIASVHDLLDGSGTPECIPLQENMRKLANFIQNMDENPNRFRVIVVPIDDHLVLPVDVAIPVSLIVHESLINSLRHAVKAGGPVTVTISAFLDHRDSGGSACELHVADDGDQVPIEDDQPEVRRGMGSLLIEGLAEQIKGTVVVKRSQGFEVILRFPVNGAGRPRYPSNSSKSGIIELANDPGMA